MKAAGQKITMLTTYDFATAKLVDAASIEGILVGDSLSMAVQGHANTLPVTLEEMIYHAEMVGRAVQHALLVGLVRAVWRRRARAAARRQTGPRARPPPRV